MEIIKKNELKILYEISMSIGNSLELRSMLKIFTSTTLRKLNCNTAVVFTRNYERLLSNIYSTPKTIIRRDIYQDIYRVASEFNKDSVSSNKSVILQNSKHCYLYRLYDSHEKKTIGVFVLVKNSVLNMPNMLIPVCVKLSAAISSCINYDKVKEQQTMLSFSLDKARTAQKAKDMFLATMSHEIRTPLNGIIGFLSLLKDTEVTQQQKEYIDTINSSSNSLLNIINDILDFSKISASKLQLDRQPYNCKKEISYIVKLFSTQIKSKGLDFIVNIDDKIPACVMCDKTRMRQVMTNLLGNALKFTSKGKIILNIKVISKTDDKVTIRFSVEDTGIGIPKNKQRDIFNSFSQADISTTRKFGGTGLGLSIVKGIIELAGGRLNINSQEGVGSEFYFTITSNICQEAIGSSNINSSENNISYIYTGSRILVAEDNKVNQMLIAKLLDKRKIEVDIANNGLEALNMYKNGHKKFDLILMDISMPILGGLESTKQIIEYEKESGIPHTPIIAFTANVLVNDKNKYFASGMDGFLSKPIDTDLLDDILLRYLDVKSKNRNIKQLNEKKSINKENTNYDIKNIAKKLDIDEEFLKDLLKTFFQKIDKQIEQLYIALKEEDFITLQKTTHAIKGSSGSLRLEKIFKLAMKLNKYTLNKDTSIEYIEYFKQLEDFAQQYKKELLE